MKAAAANVLAAFVVAVAGQSCSSVDGVLITFYGYPDNSPPSNQIAYPECGRSGAGGTGTFDDPLTMATAPGELTKCEVVYVPYLEKYVRFEDTCDQCTTDFSNGQNHIDIWTGDNSDGGQDQINCEDSLTPSSQKGLIRNPDSSYQVDTAPLWHAGTSNPCRTNHVYDSNQNSDYCSS